MTLAIQRPPETRGALLCRFPNGQCPLSSSLTVDPDDCVVVTAHGGVLGVVPPGSYRLHPQSLPFLSTAVVGGSTVQADLWFVKTVALSGVKVGGLFGKVVDPETNVACTVRGSGEYSLAVSDPARIVNACLVARYDEAEPLLAWVSQVVLRKIGDALNQIVEVERVNVMSPELPMRLGDTVSGELGELGGSGLKFLRLGDLVISLPEDDAEAIRRAQLENSEPGVAPRDARCARCGRENEGGRFCVECGTPIAGR